jgi:hypothetical protein
MAEDITDRACKDRRDLGQPVTYIQHREEMKLGALLIGSRKKIFKTKQSTSV